MSETAGYICLVSNSWHLMMIILYALAVFAEHIDDIINKQLRIVFPSYSEYFLADNMKDLGDEPFVVVGEDSYTSALSYVSKLQRDGRMFAITVGEWSVCERNKRIVKCDAEPDLWEVRPVAYGFNIVRKGNCVTFSEEGPVLMPCTLSKRQVVDFRVIPEVLQCFERAGNLLEPPATNEQKRLRRLLGRKMRNPSPALLNEISRANIAPQTFDDFLKRMKFDEKKKDKARDMLKKLWDKTHKKKLPGLWKGWWFKLFCS